MKAFKLIAALLFLFAPVCAFAQESPTKVLDKRDLVICEWNTDIASNVRFLDHETVFNSDGRKIQETEYTKLGKLWTKKYEYGADGKMTRELTYNDKGRLDSIQKFEYNEYGKKKATYTYDAKGRLVKTKVVEYRFREHAVQ